MTSLISLQNVQKSYHLGETIVQALRGVDLELQRGEFAALIGASGSGKSTLLNLLGCLDEPDNGTVCIDGVDVATLDDDARSELRNHKIGFIFQSFNLVPVLNVYENIELPLLIHEEIPASERHPRVMTAIEEVGLKELVHHIPDKLSGGQRQRVAIARALITSPRLVLADEPTANLDSDTAQRIIDLMMNLNQKRQVTFLFATHDERVVSRAARVLRIQDGVIVR